MKETPKGERSFKEGVQKRILIVDDDHALNELLCTFFKKADFEVDSAIKGADGLTIYKELRPHLVLLDLLLPDIMGFDVLKRMKDATWSEHVRFIIISGIMKDASTVSKALSDHKADAFIEKPFNVRELHNTILKHLGMAALKNEEPKKSLTKKLPSDRKAPVIPEPEVTVEAGDLGTVDIPRIISAFFTTEVTGVLKVNSGETIKAIFFEKGKPIFAASNDMRDRLGEMIIRSGRLTKKDIEDGLQNISDQNRIGTTLVQLGLITSSELYSIIQLQVREIILSTFAWTEGRYAFNFQDLAGRELIKLQTPPADLVLEGIRHHYTSDRLNHLITSKNRVLIQSENPNFRYQQLHLGSSDMKIFDAINGRSSIEKIIKKSEMPELNVLQLCYGLLAMKIIHDKVPK